jgi:hypothetical protein
MLIILLKIIIVNDYIQNKKQANPLFSKTAKKNGAGVIMRASII